VSLDARRRRRIPIERRTTPPMRRYELMLLLRPDLEDDKLQAAVEKVTRAIVNAGGSLSKVSPWGKRRLAYDIGHHREASYFLIHFDIEPAQVREIERGMLISEEIVRHLVTVLEDRGPAEELVPAAAARSTDDDGALSPDDLREAHDAAESEADEPSVDDRSDDGSPDDAFVGVRNNDTSDDEADEAPADQERAAG
jgi:small subunit ribosomal protein S6